MLIAVLALPLPMAQAQAPSPSGASLPEVLEAIQRARVATRILYVTAHPDDEPGGVLAYLSRGLGADVALLSLTRGEGGQNALGPEQAPQLGAIRTEELLRATEVYGTRLFFTRAADFGYTKTADEALQVWGEPVLEDMVRVIRTFRPHVVINHWGGVRTGHGHHQAAGILTPRAFAAAGDSKAFSNQIERDGLHPWTPISLLQLARGTLTPGGPPSATTPEGFEIPVSEVSPLWGKTWGEIGVEGYLNHRSQGVGAIRNSPFARRAIRLVSVEGPEPDRDLLARPWEEESKKYAAEGSSPSDFRSFLSSALPRVEQALAEAELLVRAGKSKECLDALTSALGEYSTAKWMTLTRLHSLTPFHAMRDLHDREQAIRSAAVRAASAKLEAVADRSELVAGEQITVRIAAACRKAIGCDPKSIELLLPEGWQQTRTENPSATAGTFRAEIPRNANSPEISPILPVPPPLVQARAEISSDSAGHFSLSAPALAWRVSSTGSEEIPLRPVPAVTLTLEPKAFVLVIPAAESAPAKKEIELLVRVRHYSTKKERVAVGVNAPAGWETPATQSMAFDGRGDQLARFTLKVPSRLAAGHLALKAYARRENGEEFRTSLEPLPSLPSRLWSEPAEARVHVMHLRVPRGLHVGYIAAENDLIPDALRKIGVHVDMLDEVALAFGDLARYDAICVGIRAYELRQDLPRANRRLLDYAAMGGTLVVQYQRDGVWNQLLPAPYPARMPQRDARITDENSPVRILEQAHAVLNSPNAIRPEDYSGWVQERGLYFWGEWDARYTAILAMKDPSDEQETKGALVVAPHGKGTYIYTGISFFRQLPEGVPGAYRLFVNLLSQSRHGK